MLRALRALWTGRPGRRGLRGAATSPHWVIGRQGTEEEPVDSHPGEKMRMVGRAARTTGWNAHLNA